MDPMFGISYTQSPLMSQFSSVMFAPGIFLDDNDQNNYLSGLDSDTRDYVLKHTDGFRTRQDVEDCVSELHGNRIEH